MTGRFAVVGSAAAIVIVLAIAAVSQLDLLGPEDPATAACDSPSPQFSDARSAFDHSEVDVTYTCEGAKQAATIYLPLGPGRHPAVVWIHGAGEATRIAFGFPVFRDLVKGGVAVLTYDKRGAGASEGTCCPGDAGHFNLLSADVEGAIGALRANPN